MHRGLGGGKVGWPTHGCSRGHVRSHNFRVRVACGLRAAVLGSPAWRGCFRLTQGVERHRRVLNGATRLADVIRDIPFINGEKKTGRLIWPHPRHVTLPHDGGNRAARSHILNVDLWVWRMAFNPYRARRKQLKNKMLGGGSTNQGPATLAIVRTRFRHSSYNLRETKPF